jgi:hypothetical protein
MSKNLWETEVLSLRIIRTDKGYMLKHNGKYVFNRHGNNSWDDRWATLDEVMEVFSKLVLSDALIPPRGVFIEPDCGTPTEEFEPDCGTPMLMASIDELTKIAKGTGC